MLALDLTLNPSVSPTLAGTNVDKIYSLVDFPSKGQSIRRVSATALQTPETLTISHRSFSESGNVINQSMARIDVRMVDGLNNVRPYAAWLVLKRPTDVTTVTPTMMKDAFKRLVVLLGDDARLTAFLAGEP
jgi:hypothetical protein